MKKPSPELVEAFMEWYKNDPHAVNEDFYKDTITHTNLSALTRQGFIDFFYQFVYDGGKVQSGGPRTVNFFKATLESKYDDFREYILEPFGSEFDEIAWLDRIDDFSHFGIGIATIYLNRVDKTRFPIINNKADKAIQLFDVAISSILNQRYKVIRDAEQQLIDWYPEFENFYRTDALTQFLIGEKVGQRWKVKLSGINNGDFQGKYWIYAPGENAKKWDEYLDAGLMGIGWNALSFDLSEYKENDELKLAYEKAFKEQATNTDFKQLADFVHRVEKGDRVFVKKGTTKIIGFGEVASDYFFDPNKNEYRHLRKANWIKSGEWTIPKDSKKLPVKTITELSDKYRSKQLRDLIENVKPPENREYPLSECSHETNIEIELVERWVRAIERKRQAIFYGPPGTGKTFVSEKLAKHIVGSGNGIMEIVQFHPSFAYEDFMQGLRPKAISGGGLEYVMVPGRFKDFCERAKNCSGISVLIIDEINRANLSRVLGEVMYLLEYRSRSVPLASGGRFQIPDNVRIIGTMNTADRSIALVDHALRRRFAFLRLYPDYEILRKYHEMTSFDPEGLIAVLERLNSAINDKHYSVGISYFLHSDIGDQIEDIWQMEIEPYIEELFFDQQQKAVAFSWEKVKSEILS